MAEKSDVLLSLEVYLANGFTIRGLQQHLTREQYKIMKAAIEMVAAGETTYLAVQTSLHATVFIPKRLLEDAIITMKVE